MSDTEAITVEGWTSLPNEIWDYITGFYPTDYGRISATCKFFKDLMIEKTPAYWRRFNFDVFPVLVKDLDPARPPKSVAEMATRDKQANQLRGECYYKEVARYCCKVIRLEFEFKSNYSAQAIKADLQNGTVKPHLVYSQGTGIFKFRRSRFKNFEFQAGGKISPISMKRGKNRESFSDIFQLDCPFSLCVKKQLKMLSQTQLMKKQLSKQNKIIGLKKQNRALKNEVAAALKKAKASEAALEKGLEASKAREQAALRELEAAKASEAALKEERKKEELETKVKFEAWEARLLEKERKLEAKVRFLFND